VNRTSVEGDRPESFYLRDERRSSRRHRTVSLDDRIDHGGSPPDPVSNPEQRVLEEERSRRLRAAIEHDQEILRERESRRA